MDIKKPINPNYVAILVSLFAALGLLGYLYQQYLIEREIKQYLIQEYNPGTCFGMPGDSQPSRQSLINLKKVSTSDYFFELRSGHCCDIRIYNGTLTYAKNGISKGPVQYSDESVPC